MKIAIVLALLLTGCAHSPVQDPPQIGFSAPIPCGPDSCGKSVSWEIHDDSPHFAQARN